VQQTRAQVSSILVGMKHNFLVAIAAAALLACGDATPPDAGGSYVATLNGPAGHDNGAAVFELAADDVESVSAITGQVFTERTDQAIRVVVVADAPGQLRFGVRIAPGGKAPRAIVIEVSDAGDQLRSSLTGYGVSFTR
jgi:hypothetical protein